MPMRSSTILKFLTQYNIQLELIQSTKFTSFTNRITGNAKKQQALDKKKIWTMENNQLKIVRFKTSHNTENELSRKCHAARRASFNSLRITLNVEQTLSHLRHTYFFRCLHWRPVTSHYCPERQNLVDDYLVSWSRPSAFLEVRTRIAHELVFPMKSVAQIFHF